jgi:hypothetical protein
MYLLPSSSGCVSVPLLGLRSYDMKINRRPIITCEGECSRVRVTPVLHLFVAESGDPDEGYEQIYNCTRCKTQRRFGLTKERITIGGTT